ncbi:hypothetical protein CEXT_281021 [Caerostris extrusa]|uniref:Uncharacterized protein n=1 Tax=Caerostris extrusa TaxID=172846 RepID=A0AAV4MBI5_CAEEX|nr:hypothetical protein CEXT_281021 [Caerostris extrusa]
MTLPSENGKPIRTHYPVTAFKLIFSSSSSEITLWWRSDAPLGAIVPRNETSLYNNENDVELKSATAILDRRIQET